MGTLKIMGEEVCKLLAADIEGILIQLVQELFKEAVSYASQVDFSQSRTSDHVSLVACVQIRIHQR